MRIASFVTVLLTFMISAAHAQRDFDRDRDRDRDRGRNRDREWVLLGEQRVGLRVDRDVIRVGQAEGWFRDRSFSALHFFVDQNDVQLIRIGIRYFNGYSEEMDVDRVIPRGGRLAVEFPGERSYIREIEMIYRSREGGGRALVKVYAEPARFVDRRPDRDRDRDRGRDRDRPRERGWDLLGEQRVGFDVERDVINIGYGEDWYRNRSYRALHFAADRNDVEMRRIRVVYINGYAEEVDVDRVIPQGAELAVDFGGERSYIRQIEMIYRSRSDFRGRALIRVYGEPARSADRSDGDRDRGRDRDNDRTARVEWVELGCQRVDLFTTDRDVIQVGRREGRFRAVRLHARGADVEMRDLKVIYSDGEPDDITVQRLLRGGERTPALDLRGRGRRIDRIELVYRRTVRPSDVVLGERIRRATVCAEGLQEVRSPS